MRPHNSPTSRSSTATPFGSEEDEDLRKTRHARRTWVVCRKCKAGRQPTRFESHADIWYIVAGMADAADLKSLRLTCKSIERVASKHLFRSTRISLRSKVFDNFHSLGHCGVSGGLHYTCDCRHADLVLYRLQVSHEPESSYDGFRALSKQLHQYCDFQKVFPCRRRRHKHCSPRRSLRRVQKYVLHDVHLHDGNS